ncbi:MAG TPA: hypothetical protein VI389_07280, partial [Geobacteraceae bacterium]
MNTPDRTILVVSHVVPYPPAAGNQLRIHRMLTWLRSEGYRVVLLLNHPPLSRREMELLQTTVDSVHLIDDYVFVPGDGAIGIRSGLGKHLLCGLRFIAKLAEYGALCMTLSGVRRSENKSRFTKKNHCPEKLGRITRHLCRECRPDAVLAEYVFSTPCLDAVPPGILKLLDTHDVFSRIEEQVRAHAIPYPLHCSPGEERAYLLRSDVIIAIQDHEARMLKELVPERPVITVGIDYEVAAAIGDEAVANTVLVVGSASPMNVHGLREFIRHAWPLVCARIPHPILRVVGRIGDCLKNGDGG